MIFSSRYTNTVVSLFTKGRFMTSSSHARRPRPIFVAATKQVSDCNLQKNVWNQRVGYVSTCKNCNGSKTTFHTPNSMWVKRPHLSHYYQDFRKDSPKSDLSNLSDNNMYQSLRQRGRKYESIKTFA